MTTPSKPDDMSQEEWDEALQHVIDIFYLQRQRETIKAVEALEVGYAVGDRVEYETFWDFDPDAVRTQYNPLPVITKTVRGTVKEVKEKHNARKAKTAYGRYMLVVLRDPEFINPSINGSKQDVVELKGQKLRRLLTSECGNCGKKMEDATDFLCPVCRAA